MTLVVTIWLFRVVGGLLIYASLFLYETEEGHVQNKLEDWRKQVRCRRDSAVSASVAVMNAVAQSMEKVFDKLFGKRLFSLRSLGTSMCYSLASVSAAYTYQNYLKYGLSGPEVQYLGAATMFFCILGFVPSFTSKKLFRVIWFIVILCSLPIVPYITDLGLGANPFDEYSTNYELFVIAVTVAFCLLSFASDVLFIVFTRWTLRRSASLTRIDQILSLILLNVLLASCLSGTYFLMESPIRDYVNVHFPALFFMLESNRGLYFVEFGRFNFLDGILCLLFLLLLVGVLLNRLLWPIIERPLYSLHRFGVIKNKKLLWTIGLTFMVGPQRGISIVRWILEKASKVGG